MSFVRKNPLKKKKKKKKKKQKKKKKKKGNLNFGHTRGLIGSKIIKIPITTHLGSLLEREKETKKKRKKNGVQENRTQIRIHKTGDNQ